MNTIRILYNFLLINQNNLDPPCIRIKKKNNNLRVFDHQQIIKMFLKLSNV